MRHRSVLAFVLLATGCAASEPSGPAEAMLTSRADATAEVCRCASHLGITVDECLDAFGFAGVGGDTVQQPVLRCVERAFERRPEALEEPMGCRAKAAKRLRSCAGKEKSCDEDALAICLDSYYVAVEQCEPMPAYTDHEVSACLDGLPADPVDAWLPRWRSAHELACQCDPASYGVPTAEQCELGDAGWACAEAVLREHEVELGGQYFCLAMRDDAYLDCVQEEPSCGAVGACADDAYFEACPPLPDELLRDVNACFD